MSVPLKTGNRWIQLQVPERTWRLLHIHANTRGLKFLRFVEEVVTEASLKPVLFDWEREGVEDSSSSEDPKN